MVLWLEYLSYKARLRELGLFRPEKRWLRGHLINAYKYLKGRHHKDGARLSWVLLSNSTRGNGHKLRHVKFHLNNEENFFEAVWTLEHTDQRGCRVSFSRGGDACMWSCATCSRWACFGGALDYLISKGPFQPQPFCYYKGGHWEKSLLQMTRFVLWLVQLYFLLLIQRHFSFTFWEIYCSSFSQL